MNRNASYFIQKLDLIKHPEGGYYRESYRSHEIIHKEALPKQFNGNRVFSTAIYFLLESNDFSSFHRIKSDEIWHFYTGSSLTIYEIDSNGLLKITILGNTDNSYLQHAIPADTWFATEVIDENSYSLIGCTVAPGFDFDDFELGKRNALLQKFPQHTDSILKFTRE